MRQEIFSWLKTKAYLYLCQLLWAGAILLLPITSLPVIKKISGAATVAPPTAAILLLLLVIWLFPYLIKKGKMPVEGIPLLLLLGVAVVSWALACFATIPSLRSKSVLTEGSGAFLTLLLGMGVYFITSVWPASNHNRLSIAIRLINISGILLLTWSLVQGFYIFFLGSHYPRLLVVFQHAVSSRRDVLTLGRVSGFAYEPSWLAHMLNIVYLPVWLSATLHGYTAHKAKLWRFSLENLLLMGGVIVLFISFSRVGVVSFSVVIIVILMNLTIRLARWLSERWLGWISTLRKTVITPRIAGVLRVIFSIILLAVLFSIYLASAVGMVYAGARFDKRLAKLIENNPFEAGGFYETMNALAIAERIVYWQTGLEIFADHPLFGVGLGNVGFYFPEKMPGYAWYLPEVTNILYYRPFLSNTKSLWIRILSETGLVGFGIFLAWLSLLWKSSRLAHSSNEPVVKVLGLAGQFVLISFILEGFSIDSFALPYLWFAMGLVSAAAFFTRQSLSRPG